MGYPTQPGFKAGETSITAADQILSKATTLRQEVLSLLRERQHLIRGLTADEAAAIMGESILSIRPRFSELKAANLIEDTGRRRLNASRRNAVVWVAALAGNQTCFLL